MEEDVNKGLIDYLPISAVAEILYCPRNFYYRIVESADDTNVHIMKGRLQEDNRSQRKQVKREDYNQIRSVEVSSEVLRLIGIVDVLEESDDVYPVEFKKGCLKESINDDVQVCAQAMVLEEKLGRDINKGYIYYAESNTRREVMFDEALRFMVKNTIDKAYEIIRSKEVPPPLADERCQGCALMQRCLPNEIDCLTSSYEGRVKRPVPTNSPGRVLYVDESGAYLRKKGERVIVTKGDDAIADIPLCYLEQVILVGTANISSQLIKLFLERGTQVHLLSKYGKYYGCL